MDNPASIRVLPVEEEDVIVNLLKISHQFKNFYDNERGRAGKVNWMVNENLKPGINAMMFEGIISNKIVPCIYIKRCPALAEDAKTIAHEITHFLRNAEKNAIRIVANDKQYDELGGSLASIVEDPIVDEMLQNKYGFNLVTGYMKALKNPQKGLRKPKYDPQDRIQNIELMIKFSGKVLEWELIDKNSKKKFQKYKTDFESSYPIPSKRSKDLISIVHEIGTDNFENRRTIYDKIIKQFGLEDMFHILE